MPKIEGKYFITIHTKENGRQQLTDDEWSKYHALSVNFHRADGPAREYSNGYKVWALDGCYFTEKEYELLIQEVKDMPEVLRLVDPRKWVREFK